MGQMLSLEWPVPADGFQWANRSRIGEAGSHPTRRFLVPFPTTRPPAKVNVFEHKALFRTFARLGRVDRRGHLLLPDEAAVVEFANSYGWLGGTCLEEILEPDRTDPKTFLRTYGEALITWYEQISLMHHAVFDLWENVRKTEREDVTGRQEALRKFIRWEDVKGETRVTYKAPAASSDPYFRLDQPGDSRFPQLQRGDFVAAGWLALTKLINQQLEEHPLHASLVDESRAGEPAASFTVQTDSMIAALWTQFARAVADNPEFRQCEECHADFEITTDKRKDARFCKDACRVRWHHKRAEIERQKEKAKSGRRAK
jgi:hypothetical protein